jgi:shikimate dehydrogenase
MLEPWSSAGSMPAHRYTISAMARTMFLVGRHIGHSYSPAMWNHLLAGRGLDVEYGRRDVAAAGLSAVRAELTAGNVIAANVTMPHKGWAAAAAATATAEVRDTGAANFLRPDGGSLHAANTDVVGARALLAMRGPYRRAVVLGAGGTAAAIVTALVGLTDEIAVVNRTIERGARLAAGAGTRFETIAAVPWQERDAVVSGADLVVNTVPATATAAVDVDWLRGGTAVYDLNYRDQRTELQQRLATRELDGCDGLAHLAAQAIAMRGLLPLDLGEDAAGRLITGLELAASRSVLAWGEPLDTTPPRRVILTGFMGTGKTAVGAILAERLGFDLVDTDHVIESRYGPIPDIFATRGEAAFRVLEREIAAELKDRAGVVVATGGGLMLDPDGAAQLEPGARVFCLTAAPVQILRRIEGDPPRLRPLLAGNDPAGRIRELLAARRSGYRRFVQVDTTDQAPAGVADRIAAMLWAG